MKVSREIGTIDSKVWCQDCAGTGKILERYPSAGEVNGKLEERFEALAVRHERKHPKHRVEIILYQSTKTV